MICIYIYIISSTSEYTSIPWQLPSFFQHVAHQTRNPRGPPRRTAAKFRWPSSPMRGTSSSTWPAATPQAWLEWTWRWPRCHGVIGVSSSIFCDSFSTDCQKKNYNDWGHEIPSTFLELHASTGKPDELHFHRTSGAKRQPPCFFWGVKNLGALKPNRKNIWLLPWTWVWKSLELLFSDPEPAVLVR